MTRTEYLPVLHGAAADRPDEADTIITGEAIAAALGRLGYRSELVEIGLGLGVVRELAARKPLLVFNLADSLDGDCGLGHLAPAVLEHFGLSYTGSGVEAHHLARTKATTKHLLAAAGLPTPRWSLDGQGFAPTERVIVKSLGEHASLGMDAGSVVPAAQASREIAARQHRFGGQFFAEAFVEGREFNLSVLETAEGPRILPVAEILFVDFPPERPRIVDYEAKWTPETFAFNNTPRSFDFPPEDSELLAALSDLALRSWEVFGLNGYARVDFRVDAAHRPTILEVNINPCLAPDAGFIAAAERAGLGFDAVVGSIIIAAMGRRRQAA